jgi:hypothetical protein
LVSSSASKQTTRDTKYKKRIALQAAPSKDADIGADIIVTEPAQEAGIGDEKSADKDGGKSPATRFKIIRQPRRSKHQRPKRG